jgi:hypothetical protein
VNKTAVIFSKLDAIYRSVGPPLAIVPIQATANDENTSRKTLDINGLRHEPSNR